MFQRNIKPTLTRALARSPVVLLNGARQVGKSTLALEYEKTGGFSYITFDDEMVYFAAKNDPIEFIHNLKKPVIIDEVQRVPEIFLPIKMDVDNNRVPGRYLLTGSANPLLIPRLGDSLAGRMEILSLMPLSQGEIHGIFEKFIDVAFSESSSFEFLQPTLSKQDLYERMIVGGYPSVQNVNEESEEAWMRSYLNLILQRDIKDLAQIEKINELPNILRFLAFRASNLLNVAEISRDAKMVSQTVHRYMALLETIFLIYLQPAWYNNETLRLIKAPKVYLIDSGLLSYLIGMTRERALRDEQQMGKILENFIVSELKKQITWSKTKPSLYHFRTSSGQEVDVVLEDRARNIVGIEIKNSQKISADDFKGLKLLQEKTKDRFIRGIVFYNGSQTISVSKNIAALPISGLWHTT